MSRRTTQIIANRLQKLGNSDLSDILLNVISGNVQNYAEEIVRGTDVAADERTIFYANRDLQKYFSPNAIIIIKEKQGENKNMSIMEILWGRTLGRFEKSGDFDDTDMEKMKSNFLNVKPPGTWYINEITPKEGKIYFAYTNFKKEYTDDISDIISHKVLISSL